MPKLKVLSGKDVISILGNFGFLVFDQESSHVKLRRIFHNQKQTLTVPNHKEIDSGTLKAIYRQASRYISESELFEVFYNK